VMLRTQWGFSVLGRIVLLALPIFVHLCLRPKAKCEMGRRSQTGEPIPVPRVFSAKMSDPGDPRDFSARRGCVWGPALIIALAILIALGVFIAQHRFPFQTTPPIPARTAPAQPK
jgi:hypothetical protein